MGPSPGSPRRRSYQARPRRRRLCLLKACGLWFEPAHPLARYCSPECKQRARRWREWKARKRYRRSEKGRAARQEQTARRRKRLAARPVEPVPEPADTAPLGHRNHVDFDLTSCDRPGCYETFVKTRRSPMQRFCSCLCRQALRRVELRERRWWRWLRESRRPCWCPPPPA